MNKQEATLLLDQIYSKITSEQTISNENYAILLSFFPTVLSQAIEILDNGKIQKIQCIDSKRYFYRVKEAQHKNRGGSFNSNPTPKPEKDELFDIMGEFCLCFFYQRECLSESGSSFYCKHVLAVKLGESLKMASCQQIEDRDFAPLFLASGRHLLKFEENKKRI